MSDVENPWKWRPSRNPYRFNCFRVLRLEPDEVRRNVIAATIVNRRRLLPDRLVVSGQRLTETDLTEAATAVSQPLVRLLQELQTHPPHRPDTARFDQFVRHLSVLPLPEPDLRWTRTPDPVPLLTLLGKPAERTFPAEEFDPALPWSADKTVGDDIIFDC